jgi:fumarate reductase subunit C
MIDFIRPDLLFSYWIYLWFFIFYFTKGDSEFAQNIHFYGNPVLVFILALVENIITLALLVAENVSFTILAKFALMIVVIKGVPLYLLREQKIHIWRDLFVLSIIFLIYNIYLLLNDTDLIEIYKKTFYTIATGDRKTPFMWLISIR